MNLPASSDFDNSRPKVFCVGINKTGTSSLELALQEAEYRTNNVGAAARFVKDWARRDFKQIIDFCKTDNAFQDVPFSLPFTYQALDAAYPDSKFILTIRTTADEWYESLTRFHADMIGNGSLPSALDLQTFPLVYEGWVWDVLSLVFGADEDSPYDRDRLVEIYNNHNRQVCDYFKHKSDRLLILNNAEDSARDKLCEFLEIENKWGSQMPHIDSKIISDGVKIHLSQELPESVAQGQKPVHAELDEAVAVVQSYCKLLEATKGTDGRGVRDSQELPCPKSEIKLSLFTVLKFSTDPTERKMLSAVFVLLADFQTFDSKLTDDTAGETGKNTVELERQCLIEELEQAGYRL